MGTSTANFALYKPADGEGSGGSPNYDWATDLNTSIDTIDSALGYPPSALVKFVSPTGSDSANGLAPGTAKATIQAAYDALKTYAIANCSSDIGNFPVGRIQLLPGDHDVGAGVSFDPRYPVELLGSSSGANWTAPGNSMARIISTSASATEFIKVYHASATASNHGFTFRDLIFRVHEGTNTALTKVLYLIETDSLVIERCGFSTDSLKIAATAIYIESRGDSAWHRIEQNWSAGMQFLQFSASPNATNYNRIYVAKNYSTYDGGPSGWPQYHLAGEVWESVFIANNIEGAATAFLMDGAAGNKGRNLFLNNSGESPNATNPFYDVQRQGESQFIGGGCTAIGGTGTWINFGTNGYSNVVIGNYNAAGASGYKKKIVDASVTGNQVLHGSTGMPMKYKSGVSPTIADSDFLVAPPNGTMAVTHDTTSGNDLMWMRSNGTWGNDDLTISLPPGTVGTAIRTTDAAARNDSTLTADDTLLFPLAASDHIDFRFKVVLSAANTTMDVKFGLTLPTGVDGQWGGTGSTNAGWGATSTGTTPAGLSSLSASIAFGTIASSGAQTGIILEGTVWGDGVHAGNVVLKIAQNTTDAGDLIVKEGSSVIYTTL